MCGVEFMKDKATKTPFDPSETIGAKVLAATTARGVVTRIRGDVYNLAPPIVTSEANLDRIVEALSASVREVLG